MAYQAIYRKWRPMVFEDIVGQGHVTNTLKNQITAGRIGHAYLFCGTRGTGKTTAAKVLARAVNCLNPHEGSPCNECEVCRGILDGSIMDVTEIDAASNNGVDNIREIRDETKYVTTKARYRVYIIDEVHMLSSGAFNALLKTLEEPPEHVIFILATTEAHKVPQTILSRCQRFDFKRIRPEDIIVRMKEIAHGDGLKVTEDGYRIIAKLADGSMRDGLSILERVVSACGSAVSEREVIDILGVAAVDAEFALADAVISENNEEIFSEIAKVVEEGRDLHVFVDSMIRHFRDLMVCKAAPDAKDLLDYTAEDAIRLKKQAEKVTYERISYIISVLNDAKAEAKWVKSPRVIYELAFVKAATPELDDSPKALLDRLSMLEEKVKNGISVKMEAAEPVQEEKPAEKPVKPKKVSKRLYNPIPPEDRHSENPIVIMAKRWDKIKASLMKAKPYLSIIFQAGDITVDADGLILIFEQPMYKTMAERYKNDIAEGVRKMSGVNCAVKCAMKKDLDLNEVADYWTFPAPEPTEPTEQPAPPTEEQEEPPKEEVRHGKTDPLTQLENDFPELIEYTDDSEFLSYDHEEHQFEQSDIDEDREEFLEDHEKMDPED